MKYKANYFIGADIDDTMKDPEEVKRAVAIAHYFEQNVGILVKTMEEVIEHFESRNLPLPDMLNATQRTMQTFLSSMSYLLGNNGYPATEAQKLADEDVDKVVGDEA